MMDYKINNFAPNYSLVQIDVANEDDKLTITVDRNSDGNIYISVLDHSDDSESRLILGKEGMTQRL